MAFAVFVSEYPSITGVQAVQNNAAPVSILLPGVVQVAPRVRLCWWGCFFCLFSGLGLALRCPPSRCPPVPLLRRGEHLAVPRGGPGHSPCPLPAPLRAEAPVPAAASQQRPRRFAPRPALPLAAGYRGPGPRPPPAACRRHWPPAALPPLPGLASLPLPPRAERDGARGSGSPSPAAAGGGGGGGGGEEVAEVTAVPAGVSPLPGAAPPP